ncbi:MAG: HigA family addiction module antitoxin [Cyanobacteria bacterium J06634_6]
MQMHKLPTPSEILLEGYLKPWEIDPAEFASRMGVILADINDLLAGHSAVTADLALRLSITLGTTPEIWLGLQQQYDLWQAQQNFTDDLQPYDRSRMVTV